MDNLDLGELDPQVWAWVLIGLPVKGARAVLSPIPHVVCADQITICWLTGFSPYFLLHGVHPALPMDLCESTFMVEGFRSDMSHADLLVLQIQQLEQCPIDVSRATKVICKATLHLKEQFEKKFAHRLRKEAFQEGELVLVLNTAIEQEMNYKHKPCYLRPYQVVCQTQNSAYIIKELNSDVSQESVAAFRLLAYHLLQQGLEDLAGDPN